MNLYKKLQESQVIHIIVPFFMFVISIQKSLKVHYNETLMLNILSTPRQCCAPEFWSGHPSPQMRLQELCVSTAGDSTEGVQVSSRKHKE
jgi:hypothetical protein